MGDLVTNTLAAELMGRYSNLVLIQSGKIIDALKRVDFEDSEIRQLLPGLPYTLPPKPNKLDFLATSAAAMVAAACEKRPAGGFCFGQSGWRCRPRCCAGGCVACLWRRNAPAGL